mgnify:CR=1 FL=1|tara:strand:+ start:400 stop:939 length:540 start_codon:yes stop_codon:yes gene_type:complete
MTDCQRQKVYNWEKEVWKHHNHIGWDYENQMSLLEAEKYATYLWNKYKNKFCHNFSPRYDYCSKVKTKNARGRRKPCMHSGFYYFGKRLTKDGRQSFYKKMCLPNGSRTKVIIIHEISHALAPITTHHGSKFVSIYVSLMAKELNFNMDYMVKTLNKANINFDFNWSKYNYRIIKKLAA